MLRQFLQYAKGKLLYKIGFKFTGRKLMEGSIEEMDYELNVLLHRNVLIPRPKKMQRPPLKKAYNDLIRLP